jgi:hypothetical protein
MSWPPRDPEGRFTPYAGEYGGALHDEVGADPYDDDPGAFLDEPGDDGYGYGPSYDDKLNAVLDFVNADIAQRQSREQTQRAAREHDAGLRLVTEQFPALLEEGEFQRAVIERAQAFAREHGNPAAASDPEVVAHFAQSVSAESEPHPVDGWWARIRAVDPGNEGAFGPRPERDAEETRPEREAEILRDLTDRRRRGELERPEDSAPGMSPDESIERATRFAGPAFAGGSPEEQRHAALVGALDKLNTNAAGEESEPEGE